MTLGGGKALTLCAWLCDPVAGLLDWDLEQVRFDTSFFDGLLLALLFLDALELLSSGSSVGSLTETPGVSRRLFFQQFLQCLHQFRQQFHAYFFLWTLSPKMSRIATLVAVRPNLTLSASRGSTPFFKSI